MLEGLFGGFDHSCLETLNVSGCTHF